MKGRFAALVFVLGSLPACATEEPGLRTLTINSPVEGRVSVDGREVPIQPFVDVSVSVIGAAATVSLHTEDLVVTVQDVTTHALDFGPFLGHGRLYGAPEETVRFRAPGAVDAVAVTPARLRRSRVDGDDLLVDVPRGEPVVLVARWRHDDGRQSVGWLRTEDVEYWLGSTLSVTPVVESQGFMAIQTDAGTSSWARAELVFERLRTGIILAEGRISSRQARASPRFVGAEARPLSVWVEAGTQALGGGTVAQTSALLGPDIQEAVLPWADELTLQPGARDVLDALPLDRTGPGWDISGVSDLSWVEAEFVAPGGCGTARWRVFGPPGDRLLLPSGAPEGLLTAPLIHGRISAVSVSGQGYSDLVGSPGGAARLLEPLSTPYTANLWRRRSVAGYWRGTLESCEGDVEPALHAAYLRGDACVPGEATPTVVRDRCGALVTLGASLTVACSLPTETGLRSVSGASVEVEEGPSDGLVVTQGGRRTDLTPYPIPSAAPPMGWTGRYQRYRVVDQLAYGDEDAVGDPLTAPFIVEAGDVDGGPWAELKADGVLEVATQTARFTVVMQAFDGLEATGVHSAPGCEGVAVRHRLRMEDGTLVLEVHLPTAEPDQVRVRRMLFSR